MALKPKTFRTSDDVISALKNKTEELGLTESEIINKALRCFLGMGIEIECETFSTEIKRIDERINNLILLNNLKEN